MSSASEAETIKRMYNYQRYFLSGQNVFNQLKEIDIVLENIPTDPEESIKFLNILKDKFIEGIISFNKTC